MPLTDEDAVLLRLLESVLPSERYLPVRTEILAGTIKAFDFTVRLFHGKLSNQNVTEIAEIPAGVKGGLHNTGQFLVRAQVADLMLPLAAALIIAERRSPTKQERDTIHQLEEADGLSHHTVTHVIRIGFSEVVERLVRGIDVTQDNDLRRKVKRGKQQMRHVVHLVHQLVAALKHQFHRGMGDYHPQGRYKHIFHRLGSRVFGRGSLAIIQGGEQELEKILISREPKLAKLLIAQKGSLVTEDQIVLAVGKAIKQAGDENSKVRRH